MRWQSDHVYGVDVGGVCVKVLNYGSVTVQDPNVP